MRFEPLAFGRGEGAGRSFFRSGFVFDFCLVLLGGGGGKSEENDQKSAPKDFQTAVKILCRGVSLPETAHLRPCGGNDILNAFASFRSYFVKQIFHHGNRKPPVFYSLSTAECIYYTPTRSKKQMRNKLWREVAIVSPKHVFGTAIPSGGIKLHGGAIAELLHIAERKRSNASSVKAKLENAEDEALSVKDQGHAKPSFFL